MQNKDVIYFLMIAGGSGISLYGMSKLSPESRKMLVNWLNWVKNSLK